MKRSEMVSHLLRFLKSRDSCPVDIILADEILEYLEGNGMFPPGYMKSIPFESDGNQYPLVPGNFKDDKGVWCTPGVQEWEPEGLITKEQAIELLNTPGGNPAGKVELIMELLSPSGEEDGK